jgi:hypothetical protein
VLIVSIRDIGRGMRSKTDHVFHGLCVREAVARAVVIHYWDSTGELNEPVVDVGTHRRTVKRETLLDRRVVIRVREQRELFP